MTKDIFEHLAEKVEDGTLGVLYVKDVEEKETKVRRCEVITGENSQCAHQGTHRLLSYLPPPVRTHYVCQYHHNISEDVVKMGAKY